MANHASAVKRHRQNIKRNLRNKIAVSRSRTTNRSAVDLAKEGKKEEAYQALKVAIKLIDKNASKGILHKNTAKRKVSRLTKQVANVLESVAS